MIVVINVAWRGQGGLEMRRPRLRGAPELDRYGALSGGRYQNGGTQDTREQLEDPICPIRPEGKVVDRGIYLREVIVRSQETRSHRPKKPLRVLIVDRACVRASNESKSLVRQENMHSQRSPIENWSARPRSHYFQTDMWPQIAGLQS